MYRTRVRNVSCSYRSQSVVSLPEQHIAPWVVWRPRQDSNLRTRFRNQAELVY
jgi:hypothetical protein